MAVEAQSGAPLPAPPEVALAVDLDGTLTLSDTLHEGLFSLLKVRPLDVLRLPAWLSVGKARFKREVAQRAPLDVSLLPYHEPVLEKLRAARAAGRRTVLATASDKMVAQAVADHLGLFDEVIASDGDKNLSGTAKRDALVERFGPGGFDYVANGAVDIPVWSVARTAILANARPSLATDVGNGHDHVETLSRKAGYLGPLLRAARVYQWVKNLLIFVPILAAQQIDGASLLQAALAFVFFSFAASSVYLINDLMDLDADRRHPRKKQRPFAAGQLAVMPSLLTAAGLIAVSLIGAFLVAPLFGLVLIGYLIVTGSYSFWIKRYPLIDVIVLAGLYTLRIIAGSAATDITPTLWLLAFAMFLFTSLAFAKRYAEVADVFKRGESDVDGRGYRAGDQNLLMALGTAAGMASIVTLALFVNNPTDPGLYNTPELLWGVCPVLLYWVAHIWLAAQRGVLTDDPIVFAVRDSASRAALVVALVPIALAIWL
jgi:4-hydroxybenzoate polyprenyltransferase